MHRPPDFDEVVIPPFEVMVEERIRNVARHERHRLDPNPRPQAPFPHFGAARPDVHEGLRQPQDRQQQPPARPQANALDPMQNYRQLQQQRVLMQMHAGRNLQQQNALQSNIQRRTREQQIHAQGQEQQLRNQGHLQQERMNEVLAHQRGHVPFANEVLGDAHRRKPREQDRGISLADIEPPRAQAPNLRRGIVHPGENEPPAANGGIYNRAFGANEDGLWGDFPAQLHWNANGFPQSPMRSLNERQERRRHQRLEGELPNPFAAPNPPLYQHEHHQNGSHAAPIANPWHAGPVADDEAPRDNRGNYWFG